MHQEVVQATRTVEVEVLGVVTTDDLSGLGELKRTWQDAENKLRSIIQTDRVIDANHMDAYRLAREFEQQANAAYVRRWNELFD